MGTEDEFRAGNAVLQFNDTVPGLVDVDETGRRCDLVTDLRNGLEVIQCEDQIAG